MFLGHENVVIVVVKHDEKTSLQLLMEVNKLLMFERAKTTFNFHSEGDSKGLFHPTSTTTDIFKDIVSKEVVGFWWFPIDVESNKCALYGGTKKNASFQPLFNTTYF
jgi:hypothetical protein